MTCVILKQSVRCVVLCGALAIDLLAKFRLLVIHSCSLRVSTYPPLFMNWTVDSQLD